MRIFLIGFMACGKTIIGQQLAKKLNVTFVDTDEVLENLFQQKTQDIFAIGEEYFRECEHEVLNYVIQNFSNAVIACGGGTPCFLNNMESIKESGISFYLKVTPDEIFKRLSYSNQIRPIFANLPEEKWLERITTLLEKREIYYKKANYIVDGSYNPCDRIIRCLEYAKYPF